MPVVALSLTYGLPWREMRGIVIAVFFPVAQALISLHSPLQFDFSLDVALEKNGSSSAKKKTPVDH